MQSRYSDIAKDIRSQAAEGSSEDLSVATGKLARLRELVTGSIDSALAPKITAGLALTLSSQILIGRDGMERLNDLLKKVRESAPEVRLPERPHDRESLIVDAAIGHLVNAGWQYSGTFEPTITLLVRGGDKIQFEQGGTPLSSRKEPGTHFDRSYTEAAGVAWREAASSTEAAYELGRAAIIERAARHVPSLVPLLESTPNWKDLPGEALEGVRRDDPLGVIAFIEDVSGSSFGADLVR